jgi:hypothetical protein
VSEALTRIRTGSDQFHIRASDVESLVWDRGHSYTDLVITMRSGAIHRVRERQGSAYDAETAILAAAAAL